MIGRVVMTGAAGAVAAAIRPYLSHQVRDLCLTDLRPVATVLLGESFSQVDLTDLPRLRVLLRGASGVIHLAGHPREAGWEEIAPANLEATHNVFEAARLEGVERLVFASSNHVTGYHEAGRVIAPDAPPRPDSLYGASKLFGEGLAALYAFKHRMRCLVIRIGRVSDHPLERRHLSVWLHPEDLAQLCLIGLAHPDLHHAMVYGVSATSHPYYDNAAFAEFGYRPRHSSDSYADAFAREPLAEGPAGRYQGGAYCTAPGDDGP